VAKVKAAMADLLPEHMSQYLDLPYFQEEMMVQEGSNKLEKKMIA